MPLLLPPPAFFSLQVGADLHFAGPANQRRGAADTISKLVFQFLARTQPITLDALQAAAAASCTAAAAGGGGLAGGDGMMGSGESLGEAGALSPASRMMSASMASASMAVEDAGTDGIEVDS